MTDLNKDIYNTINYHQNNKMITFDFKLGVKEFCYSFNNKILINDFKKVLAYVKATYNQKDIIYYKYRNYFDENKILSACENGQQKCISKNPIQINILNKNLYLAVTKRKTLPSHLFTCNKSYNFIQDEEIISVNIRKLFKLNLSVINEINSDNKYYNIGIQFIYNKNKHFDKIDSISKIISFTLENILKILNKSADKVLNSQNTIINFK